MASRHNQSNVSEAASGFVATRRGAALFLAAFVLFPGATIASHPARAAVANPTEAFIQQNVDKGYAILNNASLSDEQRRAQFRTFMLSLTDMRRIGMFTLGQYANGASKTDMEAYVAAFTDYAIAVYESRLGKYTGQTLKVTGSVSRTADDVVVNSDVVSLANPTAQPYKASFRVRKTADGRFIVTDMEVEGIWLALSQRSDFTGFLQQHNGRVSDLVTDLKRQTAAVIAGDSAGGGSGGGAGQSAKR